MRVLRTRTTIARSPAEVFAFLTDLSRGPRWLALLDRLELEGPGPLAPGSRIALHFTVGGRSRLQHTTVERYDPGRAYALRTREEGFDALFSYALVPDGPSTRVDFEVDVRPTSIWAFILYPWAIAGTRRRLADRLERLRRAVEGEAQG